MLLLLTNYLGIRNYTLFVQDYYVMKSLGIDYCYQGFSTIVKQDDQ